MCGIVGSIALGSGTVSAARVRSACSIIGHRGPDDLGIAVGEWGQALRGVAPDGSVTLSASGSAGPIALGHVRLSIIELGAAGHQPMLSSDGKVALVFNGEIYNYIELRASLSRDIEFRTRSDTEVLLAGLRRKGAAFLHDVIGMFAFAYVDVERGEVILGRDHFGIKPLFYATEGDTLHFASELKGLRAVASRPWAVSARATLQFLRFGITDDTNATFFDEATSVPPAHTLSFSRNDHVGTATRYWQLRRDAFAVDAATASDLVAAELATSVALHLRSDVPIGACLSGGLDSTALVGLMREQLGTAAEIHAFSFVSPSEAESEAPFIGAAVQAYGLVGHTTSGPTKSIDQVVSDVIRAQDAPFGSLSVVAQYAVFQSAHEVGVKVLLDGQGADELFAGYAPAVSARLAGLLRERRLIEAGQLLQTFAFTAHPGGRSRMVLSALMRLMPLPLVRMALTLAGEPIMPDWLNRAWFDTKLGDIGALWYHGRTDMRDELIAFVEERTLPALLRFEDRNSMHWSVESRVPFCTPRLAELAMSLPPQLLVDGHGRTKAALRDALGGVVPQAIVARAKIGFLAPDQRWIRELDAWVAEALADGERRLSEIVSWSRVSGVEHGQPRAAGRHNLKLWRLASYCAWARQWNIQDGAAAGP